MGPRRGFGMKNEIGLVEWLALAAWSSLVLLGVCLAAWMVLG